MKQVFGKYVLVTAYAVLALFFTTWPAQAQEVSMSGVADHLLFGYWTTEDRDTLVAVHAPLGVMSNRGDEGKNIVKITVRDGGAPGFVDDTEGAEVSEAESLTSFDICLTPGDSWTAAITSDGEDSSALVVVDPGACDEDVVQVSPTREAPNPRQTPEPGERVPFAGTAGFFEASTRADAMVFKEVPEEIIATSSSESTRLQRREQPSDPAPLTGTVYIVSPMYGFSSAYTATGVTGCSAGYCTATEINTALLAQNKMLLLGRWSALDIIGAETEIILTFPGTNHLNFQTVTTEGDPEANTDPVSMLIFKDDSAARPEPLTEIMLDQAVNKCTFTDDGMMMGSSTLNCNNGMTMEELEDMEEGAFRIFNNTEYDLSTDPQEFGTESAGDFSEAGQAPAEALAVIGTVLQAFEVDSPNTYDQSFSMQWSSDQTPANTTD